MEFWIQLSVALGVVGTILKIWKTIGERLNKHQEAVNERFAEVLKKADERFDNLKRDIEDLREKHALKIESVRKENTAEHRALEKDLSDHKLDVERHFQSKQDAKRDRDGLKEWMGKIEAQVRVLIERTPPGGPS